MTPLPFKVKSTIFVSGLGSVDLHLRFILAVSNPRNIICRFHYTAPGSCRYGTKCVYSHIVCQVEKRAPELELERKEPLAYDQHQSTSNIPLAAISVEQHTFAATDPASESKHKSNLFAASNTTFPPPISENYTNPSPIILARNALKRLTIENNDSGSDDEVVYQGDSAYSHTRLFLNNNDAALKVGFALV